MDLRNLPKSIKSFNGHDVEILDVTFYLQGYKIISCKIDRKAIIYNVKNSNVENVLYGHDK